uniref:Uncharacterized protein n=1 Tax=Glossina pallidipes TaxID=7398 RepID=A0A1B0A141_GLOPL
MMDSNNNNVNPFARNMKWSSLSLSPVKMLLAIMRSLLLLLMMAAALVVVDAAVAAAAAAAAAAAVGDGDGAAAVPLSDDDDHKLLWGETEGENRERNEVSLLSATLEIA